MIIFKEDTEGIDHRACFANNVCRFLLTKHNFVYDNKKMLEDLEVLYEDFQEFVRNIYETISNSIPLFRLYELLKNGELNEYDDYIEEEEISYEQKYKFAYDNIIEACNYYYRDNNFVF